MKRSWRRYIASLVIATGVLCLCQSSFASGLSNKKVLQLRDEGTSQGDVKAIDCVGGNIACTASSGVGTVTISDSGGAGSNNVLTSDAGSVPYYNTRSTISEDVTFQFSPVANTLSISADVAQSGNDLAFVISSDSGVRVANISHDGSVFANKLQLSNDLAMIDGGTGSSLEDPGADRILFFDDGTGLVDFLSPNSPLQIVGSSLEYVDPIWQTTTNVISNKVSSDNLTIGSSTNYAKLGVFGDTDEIQLNTRCNQTQTNNCFNIESADGTDLVYYKPSSGLTITSTGEEKVVFGSGNQAVYSILFDLSGTDVRLSADSAVLRSSSLISADAGFASNNQKTTGGFLDLYEDQDGGSQKLRLISQSMTADLTYTLPADNGGVNYVLQNNGSGTLSWAAASAGSPGGSNSQVQYNSAGSFAGDATLQYYPTSNTLVVSGDTGQSGSTPAIIISSDTGTRVASISHDGGAFFNRVQLSNDLAVADGGTGLSSGTSGGVLGYTAAGTLASSTALSANAVVIGGGAGATPTSITADTSTSHALFSTGTSPAFRNINFSDVQGTATVAQGGTGSTTGTALRMAYYPTATSIASASGLISTDGTRIAIGPNTNTKISLDVAGSFRSVPITLTDSPKITMDAAASNFFVVTLTGQPRTLENPLNGVLGQKITVLISQDVTGSRKIGFGTDIKFGSTITTFDATTTGGMQDMIGLIRGPVSWDVVAVAKGFRS